jgi:hypothetical protein
MSIWLGDEEEEEEAELVEEMEEVLRERGRMGRRWWMRWERVGQRGRVVVEEESGELPAEGNVGPGLLALLLLVVGLGRLLREERLRLWVGWWGVLGGDGRSK